MKYARKLITLTLGLIIATAAGCVFNATGIPFDNEPPLCGNGVMNPSEACDGTNLDGQTCQGLGFAGGVLICADDCTHNTGGCDGAPDCGNGVIDPDEECDGSNLGGQSCQTLGLGTGALSCTPGCTLNTTGCDAPPNCGDGVLDPDEECDDGNPQDDDACLSNCRLASCGDGIVRNTDPAEACDDGDNDVCTAGCNTDCSGPGNTCGDGVVQCGEACEAGDLQGQDCTSFGFADPAGLVCTGCALDASGCSDTCGDGVLDSGEACDDGNTNPANATDDFCAPGCTPSTWACAGSWPGYIPPVNTVVNWVTWTNTVINGSSTGYAEAAAGSTITVTGHYDYDAQASGCSGCRVQLYWGFFAGDPPASDSDPNAEWQLCADFVNVDPNEDYTLNIDVPNQVGTYYLRWGRSWEYGCPGTGYPAIDRSLAVICVY